MAEGRKTAVRAALQVLGGREVDTVDVLTVAEYLRSGRLPTDETVTERGIVANERAARLVAERQRLQAEHDLDGLLATNEKQESQLADLRMVNAKLIEQRDDLLNAARALVKAPSHTGTYERAGMYLADLVERIERELAGP